MSPNLIIEINRKVKFVKNFIINKIKYVVLDEPFPKIQIYGKTNFQRFLLKNLDFAEPEDFIFFRSDEIPDPKILVNLV